MNKNVIILIMMILCFSRIGYAGRFIIGPSFDSSFYYDKSGASDFEEERIKVCEGDLKNDGCEGIIKKNYSEVNPNINYETFPYYFGILNYGASLMFKIGLKRSVNLVDYPQKSKTSQLNYSANFIGLPIFYTFGKKDLGSRSGGLSVRIGAGPGLINLDPFKFSSQGKTVTKKHITYAESAIFTFDYIFFTIIIQSIRTSEPIELKEFKNVDNNPSKLSITHQTLSANLKYNF